ncbi:hypothetical protein E2C01_052904 [Portunus trituberculatus]|uniref:Uncharacterized protein n=1 Tax=Portunus trituberculatus TaxID=210409 RepID=A0A5B7GMY5_PORTR|nr:hypothetical protein [Portunus trituberculatus]
MRMAYIVSCGKSPNINFRSQQEFMSCSDFISSLTSLCQAGISGQGWVDTREICSASSYNEVFCGMTEGSTAWRDKREDCQGQQDVRKKCLLVVQFP